MNMSSEEIKKITDKARQPCLIGMRGFDKDVQQFTCKCFNGVHCDCYNKYRKALDQFIADDLKEKIEEIITK